MFAYVAMWTSTTALSSIKEKMIDVAMPKSGCCMADKSRCWQFTAARVRRKQAYRPSL